MFLKKSSLVSLQTTMNYTSFLVVIFFTILSTQLVGQDSEVLQSKRKVIEGQINLTNEILEKTQRNKTSTIHDYKAIQSQIKNRQELITNLQADLDSTEMFINQTSGDVQQLESNLVELESKYGQVLRAAYRQKLTQNILIQLLSSKSLKEALLKWRYTKQFESYCKKQIASFKQTKINLEQSIDTVLVAQELRKSLLGKENDQNQLLESELDQKNKLIRSLESNERKLYAELGKQRVEKTQLDQSINTIISGYSVPASYDTNPASTPNEIEASAKTFAESRGFLAWPVSEGFISARFGKQRHPTLRDVEIDNNGIDIRTKPRAEVNAVYNGIVVGKNFIPGNYNVLVIRHGDYLTVYSRLEDVTVQNGDGVYVGQKLGTVISEEGTSFLHFEIWNGKQKVNPEHWLQNK